VSPSSPTRSRCAASADLAGGVDADDLGGLAALDAAHVDDEPAHHVPCLSSAQPVQAPAGSPWSGRLGEAHPAVDEPVSEVGDQGVSVDALI
jgi:hypothetical protein